MIHLIAFPIQKIINYSGFKAILCLYVFIIFAAIMTYVIGINFPVKVPSSLLLIELVGLLYFSISLIIVFNNELTLFNKRRIQR